MNILDILYILKWFLALFIIGGASLPLTFYFFGKFTDKGYIFSKIIGCAILSYLIFILGFIKIASFSFLTITFCLILIIIINYLFYKRVNLISIIKGHWKIFLTEEVLFFLALTFWAYIKGNNPDIYGLEKYMDFGFLNSILRSEYLPPKDMWYTPLAINYYYFGHLITAVLTKFTQIPSFVSFNLMISTIFALTLTCSFSIGINLFIGTKPKLQSKLAALISVAILTFGGNLTTIYAFFKTYVPADKPVPFWTLPFLPFSFPNNFWYPNATRFIPFTIHEFPLYSFVVSDLHGHVLDIPFVLLIIAFLFSILIEKQIKFVHLIFVSFLLSVMYMTNAWDGFIYLLLAMMVIFIVNFPNKKLKSIFSYPYLYKFTKSIFFIVMGFIIFSLPFNLIFKPFVSGIGVLCSPNFLTKIGKIGPFLFEANHCQRSPIWQLGMLYGFFYFFVSMFVIFLIFKKKYKFTTSDIFAIILVILSTFLIIIPEFIYIKDIYPLHYRANTMFKLVYQAFIMLSLSCGYIITKLSFEIKSLLKKIIFIALTVPLLFLVIMYSYFAITSYYGNLNSYKSLDGFRYLKQTYPQDYDLINWINNNIKGQPVVLEANGDSYTQYARVSANTGLPTVIGWPVHEWLWRGTYDIVSPRIIDVQTLYTTHDLSLAKSLINKYDISYIVVSGLELQKYPNIVEVMFSKLGKLIYNQNGAKLYKINP
jgi:YYY domain-containing protein